MKGLVLILSLNEARIIGRVIRTVKQVYPDFDVLVVDGESRDRTQKISRKCGARVMVLSSALGIPGAMEVGLLYAEQQGYDFVIRIDADGQHPVSEIQKLLDLSVNGKADLVIGTRFENGFSNYQGGLLRLITIRIFSFFVSRAVRHLITDPTSGMQVFNRNVVIFLNSVHDFEYSEVESLVLLGRSGFKIMEVPVTMEERHAGVSSFGPARAFFYVAVGMFSLFRAFFKRIKALHPS